MADAVKNAAYSLIASAPSPATSGTVFAVTAGEGGRFPTPPFNATVWATGAQPAWSAGTHTGGNFEIVRVLAMSGGTVTSSTRAQETTTARTIVTGDQIAQTVSQKTVEDLMFDPLGYGMAMNYPLNGSASDAGAWDTANRAYFWRLTNGKKAAANVQLTPLTASGNISIAIYRSSGAGSSATPGTLVVATGSIACPAGGAFDTVSLGGSYDVFPGDWIGIAVDNTTASFLRSFAGINLDSLYNGLGGYKDSSFPLSGGSPVLDAYGEPGAVRLHVV